MSGRAPRLALLVATVVLAATAVGGCAEVQGAAPRCGDARRLAIVAQSVPGAAFLPCLLDLRPGWVAQGFHPRAGGTRFELVSDRDPDHVVRVDFGGPCDAAGATAIPPRADGVRTYLHLRSISPRYAGVLVDQFTGGCVTYDFDFARGPHIALVDDFERAVGLVSRREVEIRLDADAGLELGP